MFSFLWKKEAQHVSKGFEYDSTKYDSFLDDPNSPIGKNISNFILILTVLFIFSIALETVGNNEVEYRKYFFFVDGLISCIFAIEYIYRYIKSKDRIRFAVSPFNVVDLLSFLPFFIEYFFWNMTSVHLLATLRILRIFRLLDFVKKTPLIVQFFEWIGEYKNEYFSIMTFTSVVVIIISFLVYYFESPINTMYSSIPQAIWWWVATVTTVWYGDIYPITPLWKIFGSVLILLWPTIVTAMASITVIIFMNISKLEKGEEVSLNEANRCWNCNEPNLIAAKFCMHCWSNLTRKKRKKLFAQS